MITNKASDPVLIEEQDKELQTHAFELFKNKELTIDEAYNKAKEFLDEKRNKDNLKIIPNDSIKIHAKTRITSDRNIKVDFNCFKDNEFKIEGFKFLYYHNDTRSIEKVLEYVLDEVNKQLEIEGCVTGSVEVVLHKSYDDYQ